MRAGDEVLFGHELVRDLEATKSVVIRDVDVLPNGYLVSGGSVLPESFTSVPRKRMVFKHLVRMAAYRAVTRRIKTVESGIFATDEFSNGYFHWIGDVLQRLEAAFNTETLERTLIVPAMAAFPYTTPSLEPYGFSDLCTASPKEIIRCSELLAITPAAPTGNYRPALMHSLRRRFRDYFGVGQATRKIYVSRARTARRRIVNEDTVAAVLERFGYQRIFLEDLPLKEQVLLVGSASVLIGNHGAGLANIVWMLPETTVLELRLRGDRHNNCYFSLAAAQGIQYRYLECDASGRGSSAHSADLFVDVGQLERELAAIEESAQE